MDIVLD